MQTAPNPNSTKSRIHELIAAYGDEGDGRAPNADQWRRLLERPSDAAITLINFFAIRAEADYGGSTQAPATPISGGEAMMRYSAVSGPALEKAGGRFLVVAPCEATVMGEEEAWDLVAVGQYPNRDALFALFDDPDYREAYIHRRAAVARQRVYALTG